jgi:uncharacterized protein (TIGR04141 family)
MLAVTFGYGRFLLRTEAVVQDFGLRVVLATRPRARLHVRVARRSAPRDGACEAPERHRLHHPTTRQESVRVHSLTTSARR